MCVKTANGQFECKLWLVIDSRFILQAKYEVVWKSVGIWKSYKYDCIGSVFLHHCIYTDRAHVMCALSRSEQRRLRRMNKRNLQFIPNFHFFFYYSNFNKWLKQNFCSYHNIAVRLVLFVFLRKSTHLCSQQLPEQYFQSSYNITSPLVSTEVTNSVI